MVLLWSHMRVAMKVWIAVFVTTVLRSTMTSAKTLSPVATSTAPSIEDVAHIHQLLDAAERLTVFLAMHPRRTVSTGQGLGLAVALGALKNPNRLSSKKLPPFLHARLSHLENFLGVLLSLIRKDPQRSRLEFHLMQPRLWSFPTSILPPLPTQTSNLGKTRRPIQSEAEDAEETPGNNPEAVLLELRALLPCSPPTPKQSDACLAELLLNRRCSPNCIHLASSYLDLPDSPPVSGYALSHRLLILLIARQVGCTGIPLVNGQDAVHHLCSLMRREAESISSLGYPELLKDLFVEHVTLCGLAGYREFLRPSWRSSLLFWQRPSGCFGNWTAEMTSLEPFRSLPGTRGDAELGGGCLAHLTDVATGALGLFLTQLL